MNGREPSWRVREAADRVGRTGMPTSERHRQPWPRVAATLTGRSSLGLVAVPGTRAGGPSGPDCLLTNTGGSLNASGAGPQERLMSGGAGGDTMFGRDGNDTMNGDSGTDRSAVKPATTSARGVGWLRRPQRRVRQRSAPFPRRWLDNHGSLTDCGGGRTRSRWTSWTSPSSGHRLGDCETITVGAVNEGPNVVELEPHQDQGQRRGARAPQSAPRSSPRPCAGAPTAGRSAKQQGAPTDYSDRPGRLGRRSPPRLSRRDRESSRVGASSPSAASRSSRVEFGGMTTAQSSSSPGKRHT